MKGRIREGTQSSKEESCDDEGVPLGSQSRNSGEDYEVKAGPVLSSGLGTSYGELSKINKSIQLESEIVELQGESTTGNQTEMLSKVVYFTGKSTQFLEVQVMINDSLVTGIIDTGAERTFISSKIVEQLSLTVENNVNEFVCINENKFETHGKTTTSFKVNQIDMEELEIIVFPAEANQKVSLLLGIDFLTKNKIELVVRERLLIRHFEDGSSVRLYLDNDGKTSNILLCRVPCYAVNDVDLRVGEIGKIPIEFSTKYVNKSMLMYSDEGLEKKLIDNVRGFDGITDLNSKHVYMLSGEKNQLIKKGYRVGMLNTIVEVEQGEESVSVVDGWESKINLNQIDDTQQAEVLEMLTKHTKAFSAGDSDIGLAGVTSHKIRLTDDTPIYQRPRRFPQPINDELERQCKELLEADIIETSKSPWSSPIVPVQKKDGSTRMCIDYRKLNAQTKSDKFPVPNLLDSIFGLHGTKFFTKLDLVRGYYQIPLDESSKELTAFSTQRNHWQFKRLSFGLCNAPSAFQREIQAVLKAFPSNKVIAYIDDILIMTTSFAEHLELVGKVLQTLENHFIKIKPSKCEWFRCEVEFLGHIVSSSGIKKTPEYMAKVKSYPRPKTVGDLRQFLGLINFQRKFVPSCSEVQKPLSCLTGGRKSKVLSWSDEMVQAFDKLKEEMVKEIELGYPDYSEGAAKLELWVDASNLGAGAYLAQQQGDGHRVIGFASMTFTPAQMEYHTLERELSALRWGVKTFKPFLYGIQFILYTDHQPLIHLNNMKLICSRLARTVQELSEYNFEIRYTPGHLNCAADALSRLNYKVPDYDQSMNVNKLPVGLKLDGPPSPGGGDSLFVSLCTVLTSLNNCRQPPTVDELRAQLVGDLLNGSSKYNLKLDKNSRKILSLMLLPGQMPTLDVLLAVSRIYKIKVFVYFWGDNPVIYQYSDEDYQIVHLQCISGIHFNPLLEVKNYSPPDPHQCAIYSVGLKKNQKHVIEQNLKSSTEDFCGSVETDLVTCSEITRCNHKIRSCPVISVSVESFELCALVDTGAEISLITENVLNRICNNINVKINDEILCDIVGFSGKQCTITRVVEMVLNVGSLTMTKNHKFGVVTDEVLPYCMLLGHDFVYENDFSIDFLTRACKVGNCIVPFKKEDTDIFSCTSVMMCLNDQSISHKIIPTLSEKKVNLEIIGESDSINGLSLLTDNDTVLIIQRRCPEIRKVFNHLKSNTSSKKWNASLSDYRRHANNLKVIDGVVVYGINNVVVVPSKMVLELTLTIHFNFAHVGRDKLVGLLYDLLWHPKKRQIISDVCSTCHTCQMFKDYSSSVIPPTLKIGTSYPFEMVAADLMSLPRTSSGYVACLVMSDHYSKFVAVVPLRNKQSSTVVEALSQKVLPFLPCVPTCMLTDNGPEFVSEEFELFLESCEINHKLTTPYCPTSNGAVERVNRTIQNLLKTIITEGSKWDESLGRAVISYNNTPHVELSMAPSKFLITQSHSVASDPPLQTGLRQQWKVGHPKFIPFRLNDLVLMRVQHRGFLNTNKFMPKYDGPFRVTKVHSYGVTYELINDDTGQLKRAHHTKCRPYRLPPKYISVNERFIELSCRDSRGADVPESAGVSVSGDPIWYDSGCSSSSSGSEPEETFESDSTDSDQTTDSVTSLRNGTNVSVAPFSSGNNKYFTLAETSKLICQNCRYEAWIESLVEDNSPILDGDIWVDGGTCAVSEIKSKSVLDITYGLNPTMEYDPLPREVNVNADTAVVFHAPCRILPMNQSPAESCDSEETIDALGSITGTTNAVDWQVSPIHFEDESHSLNGNDSVRMRNMLRESLDTSFKGFGNDLGLPTPRLVLAKIDNREINDESGRRHTRSMGPVAMQPNVQSKTLERLHRIGE